MSRRVTIDASVKSETLIPLNNFGWRGDGNPALGVNRKYFTVNDASHLPVMGELHFSRWPETEWRESLERMRAGGIEVAATYVFWIHHEEEKGVWDFSGSRNLRKFISVCADLKFPLLLRIGPWAHGECRNGGFPDWLAKDASIKKRTNDPNYLALVKELYAKFFEQAKDFLWKEGGPILGIQLENEYGHVGGSNGDEGMKHMLALKSTAREVGFDVPFYTATGWGGANVVDGETLPVLSGYCDAPWAQHTNQMPANDNYLLVPSLNDTNVGADHNVSQKDHFTYDVNAYPFATAEMGAGLQVTAHRRVVPSAKDIEAMMLCKLGSGANLLGYYMYHGGTNPNGKLSTLQESRETGYPNDLPVKSYDFQAPIRESGELGDNYRALKRLHLFLQDFGSILAPSGCCFPETVVSDPEDTESLRINIRHNPETEGGFLFINNYQRHRSMKDQGLVKVSVRTRSGEFTFPALSVASGFYGIFPYNLPMGGSVLKSTNAQPLCKLGNRWFFFTDEPPVYEWEGSPAGVVTLSSHDALHAWKYTDKLYITEGDLRVDNGKVLIRSEKTECTVYVYGETGEPTKRKIVYDACKEAGVTVNAREENDAFKSYSLTVTDMPSREIHEALLQIDFTGDKAELYKDGKLVADWFTTGLPWRTALKRHGYGTSYTVKVYPSRDERYFDLSVPTGCGLTKASVAYLYEKELVD